MTTHAQTEARAIVSAILVDERLAVGYQIETLADAIVEHIATALAAKDAEMAEVKNMLAAVRDDAMRLDHEFCSMETRAERAEAQLAEARKALEPFAKLASEVDYLRHEDGSTSLHRLYARDLRAARRVLEAQGGENG